MLVAGGDADARGARRGRHRIRRRSPRVVPCANRFHARANTRGRRGLPKPGCRSPPTEGIDAAGSPERRDGSSATGRASRQRVRRAERHITASSLRLRERRCAKQPNSCLTRRWMPREGRESPRRRNGGGRLPPRKGRDERLRERIQFPLAFVSAQFPDCVPSRPSDASGPVLCRSRGEREAETPQLFVRTLTPRRWGDHVRYNLVPAEPRSVQPRKGLRVDRGARSRRVA